jgi:uncharacterized BrkB/YihY/UPF0761 family membrane protein
MTLRGGSRSCAASPRTAHCEVMQDEPGDESPANTSGVRHVIAQAEHRLADLRSRITIVDTGAHVVERDRDAAGTLLGSALALRLFLFFVPLVLLAMGIIGLLGAHAGVDGIAASANLKGQLAEEIDQVLDQPSITTWISIVAGLAGLAWTGRSLTRALVLSSALSWRLGGGQKTPPRVIGIVVGIAVGMAFIWALEQRIRSEFGLAVASVSFLAVAVAYVVLWSVLLMSMPRDTRDPGAALPGAIAIAAVVTGLQAISQFYVPGAIDDAATAYAVVGASIAVLGWFFIIGRTLAFAFALNAVVYERHGSLSSFLFGLPVLRMIPRRWRGFAEFFDLATSAEPPSRSAR